jgi:hypothetical protein
VPSRAATRRLVELMPAVAVEAGSVVVVMTPS